MEQGTPEWLEMRKNYLGASDAPIVMKVSPWSTPFQLWRKKLGLVEDEPENDNIRYGKAMEPIARKAYENIPIIWLRLRLFCTQRKNS